MRTAKRNANEVKVKCFVLDIPVKLDPVPRTTVEDVPVSMRAVNVFSSGVPHPPDDIPIVEDNIVKKNVALERRF